MNHEKRDYIIDLLKSNKEIPLDLKSELFPETKHEYELTYSGKMRKEDLLKNEDGTFPLPLQIERVFNEDKRDSYENNWHNLLVFGDNLQFIKTIYENKDPLIKDKVKGKIKMIYIDPPFATQEEFKSQEGAKAYNDKKTGAEFLEYLRRRIILAKEILAEDGSIFVHVDQKMGHYVQIIMDEVFGKNNINNEIIWQFKTYQGQTKNYYPRKHNNIYWYYKNQKPKFSLQYEDNYEDTVDAERWSRYIVNGNEIRGGYYPKKDTRFKGYYDRFVKNNGRKPKANDVIAKINGYVIDDVWTDIRAIDPKDKSEKTGYPTQKPEMLLKRIIESSTEPGDLILDFFGGSGTTMAAAEKLNRRWITCDLGKLSYLTMQKRLLTISDSKSLLDNKLYGKESRVFTTCKLGIYDLDATLKLEWDKYLNFVSQLFDFEYENRKILGVLFDGSKKGFPVKIFNHDKYKDSSIDLNYLNDLSSSLENSSLSRVYIVGPATRVKFLADFEEVRGIKFYFLKVPYEIIKELHKQPFVKFRQPKSKSDINAIDEMKGFQFIDQPDVSCRLVSNEKNISFEIDLFKSYTIEEGESENLSTISSIYVDYNSNEKYFIMDDVRFWDEIENKSKNSDTEIVMEDGKISKVLWYFNKSELGTNPVFIISDVFGNDFTIKPRLESKNERF